MMATLAAVPALSLGLSPTLVSAQDAVGQDIVVTGRERGEVRDDPVSFFAKHCFDANRLSRRSLPPSQASDWVDLDEKSRTQFGIADPAVPAFGLVDARRGYTLWLKIEYPKRPDGLWESRCTLAVIGGDGHDDFVGKISLLMRGAGTQRHVDREDGIDQVAGWRQWLWTAMPAKGSKSWRSVNADQRGAPTWLVVSDLGFYNDYDYVFVDMKSRNALSTRPLSVISLGLISRTER